MSAGNKEEIIQRDSPSRRYAAGMLYPMRLMSQENNDDELMIDVVSNVEQEDFYAQTQERDLTPEERIEDSGLEEVTPKINQNDFMPSSMGLTFCLGKDVENVTVKFEGGIYARHKIYANISDEKKKNKFNKDWWLRTSVIATKKILISDFISNKNVVAKEFQLELQDTAEKFRFDAR
uniref:Uncharacterized protein n=1 Tax=Batrachochytrium dendrobatidis (strain JAM81 / FGSC 10211) TaxID=684364 RepID=F4PEY0_BATDJ|eukprot:XP_006683162.1 hypothetical protein BATDEDRAFT_92924 [Batrachochytrium dendrobatidis JAM81]